MVDQHGGPNSPLLSEPGPARLEVSDGSGGVRAFNAGYGQASRTRAACWTCAARVGSRRTLASDPGPRGRGVGSHRSWLHWISANHFHGINALEEYDPALFQIFRLSATGSCNLNLAIGNPVANSDSICNPVSSSALPICKKRCSFLGGWAIKS